MQTRFTLAVLVVALQGPEAATVLGALLPGVLDLGFMTYGSFAWQRSELVVSRSGYTGEDGFEILVLPELAEPRSCAVAQIQRCRTRTIFIQGLVDSNESLRIRKGQWAQERALDNGEDGSVRTDAECESDDRDRRKSG